MKKGIYLLLILLIFSIFSCSKRNDNSTNPLAGNWSGTFTGDISGTWAAIISESGTVTGTAFVTNLSIVSGLNGNVSSDGKFNATVGTTSLGYIFDGQLNGNSGSGTWKNSDETESGTWSGNKN